MASSKTSSGDKSKSRFSTGTKFGLKSNNRKKRPQSKIDLEDSGVHLDDTYCSSIPALALESDDTDAGVYLQDAGSSQSNLSPQMTHNPRELSTQVFVKHCAISAPDLSDNRRISKSESPQPPSRGPSSGASLRPPEQFPGSSGSGVQKSSTSSRKHCSVLSSHSPVFSLGPDSDEDSTGNKERRESNASRTSRTSKDNRSREKSSNKNRFKKILRPLRRSHSAGSAKDINVPAHALFLRHDITTQLQTPPGRRSIDTGRGSMERQSDDSDSEHEQSQSESTKSSTSAGKPKKKTLAQDMKEKFSFLRRRPTDTSLSSKDGKLPKPTKDMVITWSTGFEALLRDKVGMEYFRDFLHTEFSEENVEFWIACEDYKNIKSNKLNARAQEIFTDYVAVQAPREINLDSKTRMATKDLMEKPDRQTFELAQKRIQALMDKDSYPRFLRSDVYQKLLTDYKIQLTLT